MKGYIGLISVLIVGAVGVGLATSILLFSIANTRSSFAMIQSGQARGLVNACAEEALQQIRNFLPYSGSGTLALGQGSCNYSVVKGSGQNRTVTANGYVGSMVRKVSINVTQINPQIIISSWQEMP